MSLTHTLVQTHRHFPDSVNTISVKLARHHKYPLLADCGEVWVPGMARETKSLPMCPKCERINTRGRGLHYDNSGRSHYVYRLYDVDGRLLYVGMTVDPRTRRQAHRRKTWWVEVDYFRLTIYPDRATAARVEAEAIRAESPIHNVRGRGRRADLNLVDMVPGDTVQERKSEAMRQLREGKAS